MLIVLGWMLLGPATAAADGVVVFGSFTNAEAAEAQRRLVEERLHAATRITLAEVNGRSYHRIVSAPYPEAEARQRGSEAKAAGFGAWFLAVANQAPARDELAKSRAVPALQPQQAPATMVAPPIAAPAPVRRPGDSSSVPVAAKLDADTTRAVAPPVPATAAAPATAPRSLTLAVGEHDGLMRVAVPRLEDASIIIDGLVDEPVWASVPVYDEMRVIDPDSLAVPQHATQTRMLFTSAGLYLAAVMEQPADSLIARLSGRDEFINRDSYGITLDTSGEGLYGYWFVVNLGGSVMDGKIAPERSYTNQWDGPWQSRTARTANGWSVEMFLPWSMMTMPEDGTDRTMGFWVNRKVAYLDERYSWPALPFGAARFMSALAKMEVPQVQPKRQLALFPFASSAYDNIPGEDAYRAGLDIFWRPSSNLQLTATLNPDFGAVESDDVVVNLTAFETYFPEKRLFFLEGSEVFVTSPRGNPQSGGGPGGSGGRSAPSLFTQEPTTLMNTRRIGGAARQVTIPDGVTVTGIERSKPSELMGALKLVGQSGGLRYGILGAFEDDARLHGTDDATGMPVRVEADGRDYGVTRVLYETSGVGRRSIGYMGTVVRNPTEDAVTHGIDAHMLSPNGRWTVDSQYLYSDVDKVQGQGFYTDVRFTPRTGVTHRLDIDYIDDKLDISDFGFIRQNNVAGLRYSLFTSTSKGLPGWLRSRRTGLFALARANTDGRLTTGGLFAFGTLLLSNNTELRGEIDWYAPHWDDRASRGNGIFKLDQRLFGFLSVGSSSSKPISASFQVGFKGEDRGSTTYFADIGWTWRPVSNLSFDFDYRMRKLDGWLVYQADRDFTTFKGVDLQPRLAIDYFITARQQLRLTMQWAGIKATEQRFWQVPLSPGELVRRAKDPADEVDDFTISRLTAQLRYRWEIGPLSDLFVVYTRGSNLDNRITADFEDLFHDSITNPIVDILIVKLRYRLGS